MYQRREDMYSCSRLATLLVIVLTISCWEASCTSQGEIAALQDLYEATGGDNWYYNTNWGVGDPCDSSPWYGVACYDDTVASVTLVGNNLDGTVPDSISGLYAAKQLVLEGNPLTGSIPSSLSGMKALQTIELHGNQLSGTIPDSLGDLLDFNLSYLDLSNNELSGAIPSFFDGAQDDFHYVDLSGNDFDCPIPSWAAYTQAQCSSYGYYSPPSASPPPSSSGAPTVTATNPVCTDYGGQITVYGSGFANMTAPYCAFRGPVGNATYTLATVLDDGSLLCQAQVSFSECDGTEGNRMYTMADLSIETGSASASNSLQVGILNTHCKFPSRFYIGEYPDDYLVQLPDKDDTLSICTNTRSDEPYQCAYETPKGSSLYVQPTIPAYPSPCEDNSDYFCLWAARGSLEGNDLFVCPTYQCIYVFETYECTKTYGLCYEAAEDGDICYGSESAHCGGPCPPDSDAFELTAVGL